MCGRLLLVSISSPFFMISLMSCTNAFAAVFQLCDSKCNFLRHIKDIFNLFLAEVL